MGRSRRGAESESDSEVLALVLAPGDTWSERLQWTAQRARGSYSLALLAGERLIGVRDPMGNRPLSLGRLANGWALALSGLVHPGRTRGTRHPARRDRGDRLAAHAGGWLAPARHAFCAFEYIYIARPDALFAGRAVHAVRRAIGEELGREQPAPADLVIGVPDSGTRWALGYATSTGIPSAKD